MADDRARGRGSHGPLRRVRRVLHPREMVEFSPGGRKDAYSGTCGVCAQEGASGPAGPIRPDDLDGLATLGGVRHDVGGPSDTSGGLAVPDSEE